MKIFLAFADDFDASVAQVRYLLESWGYVVVTRRDGVVEDCDTFLGFITPQIGRNDDWNGSESLTAVEVEKAMELGMPRFMVADHRVAFAHTYSRKVAKNNEMVDEEMSVLDLDSVSKESVKLYRKAIIDNKDIKAKDRIGNWVHPFVNGDDPGLFFYLESQLSDTERVVQIVNEWRNGARS